MNNKILTTKDITWKIVPSGDSCLVIEIQSALVGASSHWAAGAAAALRHASLPGITDVVSTIVTVGVHYRPEVLRRLGSQGETSYQAATRIVATVLNTFEYNNLAPPRVVQIPVSYGGDHGPDLETVASECGLSAQALIDLHTGADVSVQMLGFAPGHPYIGTFDERLAPPRRAQPRTSVPIGSVGLANRQSVIYPFNLPGGWNLIGRTPLKLFDPDRNPACLLQAGDRIRFVSITADEFETSGDGR